MHKTRASPASVRIARMLRELAGPMIEEGRKAPESAARLPSEKAPDGRKRFLRRTLANLATATRKGR
jgi:hypothetical protein